MSAKHLHIILLLVHKKVLLVNRLQLVPKHIEIILEQICHRKLCLTRQRIQHIHKRKRSWQDPGNQVIFSAFECRHELLVGNQVVNILVCGAKIDWHRISHHLCLYIAHLNLLATVVLSLFDLLLLHLLNEDFLDCLLSDDGHDQVKVLLCSLISVGVEQNLGADIDSTGFTDEKSFNFLEHLQDLQRVHASILIIITQLKHH